jgi:anti-anti-sigma regulatory factor
MTNTHTVREAVAHCLARKPDTLSLDLSGLTFCGGGGIHSLHWALQRAEADNVEFRIVAPAPLVAPRAHRHPGPRPAGHLRPTPTRACAIH